jgi:hypothetical protein
MCKKSAVRYTHSILYAGRHGKAFLRDCNYLVKALCRSGTTTQDRKEAVADVHLQVGQGLGGKVVGSGTIPYNNTRAT